ncbi:MAG: hypothetical protein AAGF92_06670 [Myxococcota bacterium]
MVEVYGAVAVTLMVLFYTLERRSRHFVLAFSVSCLMSASYAVAIQSWPFAVVETIWAGVALQRWWQSPERTA